MKYLSLLAFVSGIVLSACFDPEGNIELKGKVLDESTKAAIPNRTIIILALEKDEDNFITSHEAGYFFTDSSGCFSYTLRKVRNASIYNFFVVGDSSYAFSNNRLSLTELHRYDKFLSFHIAKLTDLKIKIDRTSKIPLCDTLYISWKSNRIDGNILYQYKVLNYEFGSNRLEWIGGEIHSAIQTKVYADKKTMIRFKLFRNGKYKEIVDTVFCLRDASNIVNFKY